jgi:hypothetical protein
VSLIGSLQDLQITNTSAPITLGSILTLNGQLIVASASSSIGGGGHTVTAHQWQVTGLTVNNAPMILNEAGTILSQTFDGVTFQGFPITGTTDILMDLSLVGINSAPRTITFNTTTLQTTLGAGGLYVRARTEGSPQFFNVVMSGSNVGGTGGDGPTRSDPANQQSVNGAQITWP